MGKEKLKYFISLNNVANYSIDVQEFFVLIFGKGYINMKPKLHDDNVHAILAFQIF